MTDRVDAMGRLRSHAIWVCLLVLAGCGSGSIPRSSGVALPGGEDATPLLWTDRSQPDRWQALQAAIGTPTAAGFLAYVRPMTDAALDGLSEDGIRRLPRSDDAAPFVLVADSRAQANDEFPILVVDLSDEHLPSFRVTARCLWAVENNLSIANVDWQEFLEATGADGIFRDC